MNLEEYQAIYESLADTFFRFPSERGRVDVRLKSLNIRKFKDRVQAMVLSRAIWAIWLCNLDTPGTGISDAYNLALMCMGEL